MDNKNCNSNTDNIYAKEYYKKVNQLIYNEIVAKDKRKLLFVTINKNLNSKNNLAQNDNLDFISSSIKQEDLPGIYLDQAMRSYYQTYSNYPHFEKDGHWNEIGHEVAGNEIFYYLKRNNIL